MDTYTIGYRVGGHGSFQWKRTLAFPTKAEAQQALDDTRRAGYPAFLYRTKDLDSIGLPETFEASSFLPVNDEVSVVVWPNQR